jgi:hypothetical protein
LEYCTSGVSKFNSAEGVEAADEAREKEIRVGVVPDKVEHDEIEPNDGAGETVETPPTVTAGINAPRDDVIVKRGNVDMATGLTVRPPFEVEHTIGLIVVESEGG